MVRVMKAYIIYAVQQCALAEQMYLILFLGSFKILVSKGRFFRLR